MASRESQAGLLDAFLPVFEFREVHSLRARAAAPALYDATKAVTPPEIRLLGPLFAIRTLPALLTRRGEVPYADGRPLLEQMIAQGFVLLGDTPGQELALGAVGRFWKPVSKPLTLETPREFASFDRAGYAKAAISISVQHDTIGRRAILRTETRVHVPDPAARRTFAVYWLLLARPGGGLLRHTLLQAIKRRAEKSAAL